jgi:hypothetical protein
MGEVVRSQGSPLIRHGALVAVDIMGSEGGITVIVGSIVSSYG